MAGKVQIGAMTTSNRKGITVRFEDSEMDKLEELADRYHVSSATIIRWALKALADYVEINGGKITLPLDFSAFYRQAEQYPGLKVAEDAGNVSSLSTDAPGAPSVKYPAARRRKSQ